MQTTKRFSTSPSDLAFVRANIPCQAACPACTDIPAYIQAVYEQRYHDAYHINRLANVLPGVLGRICTRPCEKACRHVEEGLGKAVSICHLKRAAADFRRRDLPESLPKLEPTGKRVAIIGAGPAGLAAAQSLVLLGHTVTLFEAMPKPGGMLIYGIPSFRLPEEVVEEEIAQIQALGVRLECNVAVGKKISLAELRQTHEALLMATGCPLAKGVGMAGEHLDGFFTGLDFLVRINSHQPPSIGREVVVFGGGFTALDCARSAKRLGAGQVTLCIRRNVEDLPVSAEEIAEGREEGVQILNLVSPFEIKEKGSRVCGVAFRKNELVSKPGQRRPVPTMIAGTDFFVPADTVIGAIGQEADPSPLVGAQNFSAVFDPSGGNSQTPGLFAAGDCLRGASTVIEAIAHAQEVSLRINGYLMQRDRPERTVAVEAAGPNYRKRSWDFLEPLPMPTLPVTERRDREVDRGYDANEAHTEAKRCYQCCLKYEIDIDHCVYCRRCMDVCPRDCIVMTKEAAYSEEGAPLQITPAVKWNEAAGIVIQNERCIRCGECLRVCPAECIHIWRTRWSERNGAWT